MNKESEISRRQFVSAAISAATVASLPLGSLSLSGESKPTFSSFAAGPASNSDWKNDGVLNLVKSPHAKLRNVPVHAVTITSGFWAARRQTNVEKSIPSMEKLLEANGRMENFLRLEEIGRAHV